MGASSLEGEERQEYEEGNAERPLKLSGLRGYMEM